MRVPTLQLQRQGVNAILERQSELADIQQQLATGKRYNTPSDDPQSAKRVLNLEKAISLTEQYQANTNIATSRLGLEESTLNSLQNLLRRVRELAVRANNANLSDIDRQTIAGEVNERIEEMLGLANTRDSNGEYIFAGYKAETRPFSIDGTYSGDEGQRQLQVSASLKMAVGDSGTDVFRAINNGNGTFQVRENGANTGTGVIDPGTVVDYSAWVPDTYTITINPANSYTVTDGGGGTVATGAFISDAKITFAGIETSIKGTPAAGDSFTVSPSANEDIFTTLTNLATALQTPLLDDAARGHFHNSVSRFLTNADQAIENVSLMRTKVGSRLNAIDSQQAINEDLVIYAKQTLSSVQDLDYASAISKMQLDLMGLQAAQQAFVRVQGLSLFNLLG